MPSFKATCNEQSRRFGIDNASYDVVLNKLATTFKLTGAFSLSYVDDEGDNVCIASDLDMQQAIRFFELRNEVVRLTVKSSNVTKSVAKSGSKKALEVGGPTGVKFFLNGEEIVLDNVDPSVRLSDWLRGNGYTGTKVMCQQGGCGACTVLLSTTDAATSKTVERPVCACLRPLASVDGYHVTTTEGIGGARHSKGYHAVQSAIAKGNGSQCGFCTPGMVMTMFSLLSETDKPTPDQVENQFAGNICRCTGYRPILQSFQDLAKDVSEYDMDVATGCAGKAIPRCPGGLKAASNGAMWYKATTLEEMYTYVNSYYEDGCYLASGHTGVGVFPDLARGVAVYIKDIPELAAITVGETSVKFGASVSIDDVIATLASLVDKCAGFKNMADHLGKVAGKQVRSYGSWSGNVMLAQQKTFPSDVVTVFATAGAMVEVADVSVGTTPAITDLPLLDVVNGDMTGKIILSATIKFAQGQIRTIKVMPRAQNAHALINCGINAPLDGSTVTGPVTIVYGGATAKPLLATATAAAMASKDLSTKATLDAIMTAVSAEVVCDDSAWKKAYRQSLVPCTLYKLILQLLPAEVVNPKAASAATPFVRPISSGTNTFAKDPGFEPVGQAIPKIDAEQQAAGEALYPLDMPIPSNGLFAAFVTSTKGNADIASLDPTPAQKSPGVVRVLTAADFPAGSLEISAMGYQEKVLVTDHVDYYGQAIALVIADTQANADAAAKLVLVSYKNEVEPITSLADAIAKESFWPVVDQPIVVGDVEAAFASAAHIIEGGIGCPSQYHFTMETQTTLAVPEEGNRMRLESSTQWPQLVQMAVADALSVSNGDITVNARRLGGAYGGKITVATPTAVAAALCANVVKRPVRIRLNIQTNMEMVGKRIPHYGTYKIGTDENGKLLGVSMKLYADSGYMPGGLGATMAAFDNVYSCPNWHVTAQACKTNTAANTSMRGPGFVPGTFIMEGAMEHVAEAIGKPATEVRAVNFYKKGETTPYGYPLNWVNISEIYTKLLKDTKHTERMEEIAVYNTANHWTKRALSVVPVKYGIGWAGACYGTHVNIVAADGSIQVSVAGIEMGQGLYTKVAQVVANTLGAPLSKITVLPTTTDVVPNAMCTGGSIGSEINCTAVQKACEKLVKRIQPFQLTAEPGSTWEQVVSTCAMGGVQLFADSWVNPVDDSCFKYCSYGAAATEVEVDVLTGETQVLKADLLWDCGVSLNPDVDIGQIEGAFVQGLGYHLTEDLVIGADGKVITNDTWEYKPPCSQSIPIEMNTTLLTTAPNPVGFMRSKAIGEPPYCATAACFLAAKTAVTQARAEGGQAGYFAMNSPATTEHLHLAAAVDPATFFV